jgi:hypothetical protein
MSRKGLRQAADEHQKKQNPVLRLRYASLATVQPALQLSLFRTARRQAGRAAGALPVSKLIIGHSVNPERILQLSYLSRSFGSDYCRQQPELAGNKSGLVDACSREATSCC